MSRLARLLALAACGAAIAVGVYLVAVWLAFRWLGNDDELTPAHRLLLDREAW